MTTLHVGAVLDRLPTHRYCEQLSHCEYTPRAPLPRVPTLKRWFFSRKFDVSVGLVAPKSTFVKDQSAMRLSELEPERVRWLIDAARALEATYVLLPTGRELTPGARDRQRLAEYCQQLRDQSGRPVVWAPGGLWEPEAAASLADELGIGLALDILEQGPPPHAPETVYARISAIGTRARLGQGHMDVAIQSLLACGATTAYLSIEAEPPTQKALAARDVALAWADDDGLQIASPSPLKPA